MVSALLPLKAMPEFTKVLILPEEVLAKKSHFSIPSNPIFFAKISCEAAASKLSTYGREIGALGNCFIKETRVSLAVTASGSVFFTTAVIL